MGWIRNQKITWVGSGSRQKSREIQSWVRNKSFRINNTEKESKISRQFPLKCFNPLQLSKLSLSGAREKKTKITKCKTLLGKNNGQNHKLFTQIGYELADVSGTIDVNFPRHFTNHSEKEVRKMYKKRRLFLKDCW